MSVFESRLLLLSDKNYAVFQSKLLPTIEETRVLGVRVPHLRKFAREVFETKDANVFIKDLPHNYYDENILHALILSLIDSYDNVIYELEKFLPYVDNWAVCDIMQPKILGKKESISKLLAKIKEWIISDKTYTIRFGVKCLMNYFLDDNFKKEYLEIPANIHSDEYYVNMMIAWFYATALAKKWDDTIVILENRVLDRWVHNKTIQKAIESYIISDKKKDYLRKLRV